MPIAQIDVIPTDYDKWMDASKTWGAQNPSRAQYTASLIPDGVHVLDIGAASMVLRRHLKPRCTYTPSDIVDRGEGCIVSDLNLYEFPHGHYDWISVIGVLEYINDVRWVITRAGVSSKKVLLSYNYLEIQPNLIARRESGWHSHLDQRSLEQMISESGCQNVHSPAPAWYIISCDRGA